MCFWIDRTVKSYCRTEDQKSRRRISWQLYEAEEWVHQTTWLGGTTTASIDSPTMVGQNLNIVAAASVLEIPWVERRTCALATDHLPASQQHVDLHSVHRQSATLSSTVPLLRRSEVRARRSGYSTNWMYVADCFIGSLDVGRGPMTPYEWIAVEFSPFIIDMSVNDSWRMWLRKLDGKPWNKMSIAYK